MVVINHSRIDPARQKELKMKSKTFEQAKAYYEEKGGELLQVLHDEYPGNIDHQIDENYDQVAVWFNGFSLCYQDSDMNGGGKGEPHWSNSGADSGIDELKEILKGDERFQPLIAEDEYWCNEYLNDLINDFCVDYAEKHDIAGYFLCNN